MKITYLGHSGFIFDSGIKVVIDPFLTGNPKTVVELSAIKAVDILLVTHSHPDHLGDAYSIAKNTGAILVGTHDLAIGGEVTGEGMNYGGTINIKGISITMVKADHAVGLSDSAGFVWIQGGKVIYHMGDTSLFSDIKLIGELYRPEILCVPIGDRYTMDPKTAAIATSWIKPKVVIPMHYKTFPFLVQDAGEFKLLCEKACDAKMLILEPGQIVEV
ncbi:MAG: metal-dependent hydrolase [Actinobacteria bacterium]|nr:metal-dependent hydrolase [Actinomycetota bacterium]